MNSFVLTAWQRRRLERQLHRTPDARLYRRLLAVLEVARGKPVTEVGSVLGVSPRSVYYWLHAYAQEHDPDALREEPRSGRPSLWIEEYTDLLLDLMGQSPQDWGYAAVDWTVPLLQDYLEQRLGQWFSDDTLRRELQRWQYVWKRSRYVLDPDPELEKKNGSSAAASGSCRSGRPCWPKTRPTCCCSRPCARAGRCAANPRKCSSAVATPGG